jgi:hypothetical protein
MNENDNEFYYNLYKNEQQSLENIHGYDLSFSIGNNNDLKCNECINFNNKNYSVISSKTDYGLDLQINQDTIPLKIVDFVNANPAFGQSENSGEKIIQKIESPKYTILMTYISVSGEIKGKKKTLDRYQIKVLVQIK